MQKHPKKSDSNGTAWLSPNVAKLARDEARHEGISLADVSASTKKPTTKKPDGNTAWLTRNMAKLARGVAREEGGISLKEWWLRAFNAGLAISFRRRDRRAARLEAQREAHRCANCGAGEETHLAGKCLFQATNYASPAARDGKRVAK